MSGTHQFMHSLNPPLPLNILTSTVSMFLSVTPNIVREKGMVAWSADILIRLMPSLPETFVSTPEYVGGWRPWLQPMKLKISVMLLRH